MTNNFILDCETTGLHPIEDRLLCCTIMHADSDTPQTFYGQNEKLVLEQIWVAIEDANIIGFCTGFDMDFLVVRSMVNNVEIKNVDRIIDLRKAINKYDPRAKGTLRDWAKRLGFTPNTTDGYMMEEFYHKKDWMSIKAHCEEDVKFTKALCWRCQECHLFEHWSYGESTEDEEGLMQKWFLN